MERRFAEQARISVASAEALLPRANAREQALVGAVRRLVDGDWDGACAALDRVLVDHPRTRSPSSPPTCWISSAGMP
jgi:hypothetical protein